MQQHAFVFLALSLPLLVVAWACLPGRDGRDLAIAIAAAIVLMLPLMIAHEGIHLLLHPGMGRSGQSVVGGSSKHGALYAMSRRDVARALCRGAAGAVPDVDGAAWLVCLALGKFVPWAAGVSVLNGTFACADLMGAWLILRGSPKGARMRNRGYYTWWRPAAVSASS